MFLAGFGGAGGGVTTGGVSSVTTGGGGGVALGVEDALAFGSDLLVPGGTVIARPAGAVGFGAVDGVEGDADVVGAEEGLAAIDAVACAASALGAGSAFFFSVVASLLPDAVVTVGPPELSA